MIRSIVGGLALVFLVAGVLGLYADAVSSEMPILGDVSTINDIGSFLELNFPLLLGIGAFLTAMSMMIPAHFSAIIALIVYIGAYILQVFV